MPFTLQRNLKYFLTHLVCLFLVQEKGVDPDPGEKPDRPPIEIEKLAEKEAAEPLQIKVPVEVGEGKNKEEEVQLDRPEAGNAFI